MKTSALLADAFERVSQAVHQAVGGLSAEQLGRRLDPDANSIAWLVWHLTRVQDDHIADASGLEQVWTAQGWAERFALPVPERDTGYGHSSRQVGQIVVSGPELLIG